MPEVYNTGIKDYANPKAAKGGPKKNKVPTPPEIPELEVDVDPAVEKRAKLMNDVDYSIYDKKNPHSLVNKADPRTAMMVSKIPQRWAYCTEAKIVEVAEPDDTMLRLRISFWEEYNRSVRTGGMMARSRICYGICSVDFWAKEILNDWRALAFIIRPPRHEIHLHKALLLHGYDRIAEVLKLPIQSKVNKGWKEEMPNGKFRTHNTNYMKVDVVAIRAIRDTVKMLINSQTVYTLAEKYGREEGEKKKKAKYPAQELPEPDMILPDPDDLQDEIEELEDYMDGKTDVEDETGATELEHEEKEEKLERPRGRPRKDTT